MRAPSQVTTTSSIDGWRVDAYLGVVASHVVAGTGFGSDFVASFTDLFGGRSGTYQNQLTSLYNEAIGQLHRRAEQLGGNWIIGLKVDVDEVSGKGTQMFMVTAVGTAVRASPDSIAGESTGTVAGRAAALEVQRMERRLKIAEAQRANELVLGDQDWEFIVDQRVEEAAPAVLRWTRIPEGSSWESIQEQDRRRPLAYFRGLPPDTATEILHEALCDDPQIARVAIGIMRDLSLVSLRASLQGIHSTNLDLRRRIIQALEGHQQSYTDADVAVMDELIREIPRAFEEGPDMIQAKGLLGGKKDRWICEVCGYPNSVAVKRCGKCNRDTRGFLHHENTPEKAIAALKERRRALAALFPTDLQPTETSGMPRDPLRTTV
jgi:uncharacterized protein YbjQ (UPF0145 family)